MQKHNLLLKNYVITLRKGGKTYDQINKITGRNIPKSTLSYWSHGISFSPKQKLRHLKNRQENIKRAQRLAWAANKRRREMYLSKITQENEHFLAAVRNADVAKIVLIILYLCELPKHFYTARIDPRTKGKRSQKQNYKGVCRIDYFSGHIFTELMQIGNMLLSGS